MENKIYKDIDQYGQVTYTIYTIRGVETFFEGDPELENYDLEKAILCIW